MRTIIIAVVICFVSGIVYGQDPIPEEKDTRNHAVYLELAGRAYLSLNYETGWNAHRISLGFGFNDFETYLDSLERVEKAIDGDHEVSPYLTVNLQYSYLIGKRRSKLELGIGTVLTAFDLERGEFAHKLYGNESYVSIYPLIGYRYQGPKGFLFMFTFNPLIELSNGTFWPIPGISAGYRF